MPSDSIPRTIPTYQQDGQLTQLTTEITGATPTGLRSEQIRQLFKNPPADSHIVTTAATIFHPQGGGQPSDTGQMMTDDKSVVFHVISVRQENPAENSQIFHLGRYDESSTRWFRSEEEDGSRKNYNTNTATTTTSTTISSISSPDLIEQNINATDRHLYSRLHTAGHLLGLATRHYLATHPDSLTQKVIDGKASHFPGMSSVEFLSPQIGGAHREAIQKLTDEYVAADMPVSICEWDEMEVRDERNRVFLPENIREEEGGSGNINCVGGNDRGDGNDRNDVNVGKKYRCVSIGDKGAYPCGGTHVRTTKECGRIDVYKISRAKGVSKISYRVES